MDPEPKSFSEVSILEAAIRQVRVELRPVEADRRQPPLVARLLGLADEDRLALSVPRDGEEKVLVPAGTRLELTFALGRCVLRGDVRAAGACAFQASPLRRVDALLVHRPERLTVVNRRREPRRGVDPHRPVAVSVWAWDALSTGDAPLRCREGRLANRSDSGLGVQLRGPAPLGVGQWALLRLEEVGTEGHRLVRGVLRHCTQQDEHHWLAGFSDVTELRPGQAVSIVGRLARP